MVPFPAGAGVRFEESERYILSSGDSDGDDEDKIKATPGHHGSKIRGPNPVMRFLLRRLRNNSNSAGMPMTLREVFRNLEATKL